MTKPGNGSVPGARAGKAPRRSGRDRSAAPAVDAAVSQRARAAVRSFVSTESAPSLVTARSGPGEGLLAGLRRHLLAGETHYPDRPGMGELRRRVGEALPGAGFPAREPDGVLITQGEGESLFVTLLGLGGGEEATIVGHAGGRHQRLLDWMRVRVIEPGGDAACEAGAAFHLIEHQAGATTAENGKASPGPRIPRVHAIGDRLFAADDRPDPSASSATRKATSPSRSGSAGPELSAPAGPAADLADVIVIGALDGLEEMHPFSLGFVAAPAAVRPRIAKWKQASSICSPAPSQRAALWALGVRP